MTIRSLILFPHEVRAALDDRLGLVVRPVKFPDGFEPGNGHEVYDDRGFVQIPGYGTVKACLIMANDGVRCPLGVPGDRLVGKETWAHDALSYPHFQKSMTEVPKGKIGMFGPHFHADAGPDGFNERGNWLGGMEWRSPAAMPAWASRITLEVAGVRVCRVQELTEEDADDAVFYGDFPHAIFPHLFSEESYDMSISQCLARVWNAKYAKRGLGWDQNPWAWVAEVRRVDNAQ